MPVQSPNVRSIFEQALELHSKPQRQAYLDEACGGNPELRDQVDALLEAHAEAGSFLEPPAADLAVTTDHRPIVERPGTVIGPYKLLQQIGEGGMGVVFMAEQTEPIQRTVALKIIKPGMDTRQVIARFEAERQALALMDHPNIARVLDAGTTDDKGAEKRGRESFAGTARWELRSKDSRPLFRRPMRKLDHEIHRKTEREKSLDDVVRLLAAVEQKVSLERFRQAVVEVMGEPAQALSDRQLGLGTGEAVGD